MNILICGSEGFLGKAVSKYLREKGYVVNAMHTKDFESEDSDFTKRIEGKDVVINLCGAPMMKPYSLEHKNFVYSSRIDSTQEIANAIFDAEVRPKLFISISSTDIYRPGRVNIEDNPSFNDGYLGRLCVDWERIVTDVPDSVRTVILRMGTVLSRNGGLLKRILPSFRAGFGSYYRPGNQWLTWIHIEDVLRIVEFAIENEKLEGPINVVAPKHITYKQFARTLASVLKRPLWFRTPEWMMRGRYGEFSKSITQGSKVFPRKLKEMDFDFLYSDPRQALEQILGKKRKK